LWAGFPSSTSSDSSLHPKSLSKCIFKNFNPVRWIGVVFVYSFLISQIISDKKRNKEKNV
jgi:hypothetical protein